MTKVIMNTKTGALHKLNPKVVSLVPPDSREVIEVSNHIATLFMDKFYCDPMAAAGIGIYLVDYKAKEDILELFIHTHEQRVYILGIIVGMELYSMEGGT